MSSESWKTMFEIIGLILLALTFMDAYLIWHFTSKVANEQKEQSRQFALDLSKQQERAANAEAALYRLQQQRLPRMLSAETLDFLKGKASGRAEIMYKRDDSEAYNFAFWIWAWLASGGWNASKPSPIPENIPADKILEVLRAQPLGVTVAVRHVPDNPKRDDPYSVLTDALLKSLEGISGADDKTLADGILRIIVMQKP